MSALPIRTFGDPVLRDKARPVEQFDDALKRLAEDMIRTMHEAPGVGLAAPQVGRPIRLIVFDVGDDDETGPRAVANPVLKNEWGEQMEEEGCLSLPGLYYPVKRAQTVWAEGFDLDGHAVTIEGEDLLARVLQHEVDHLNGILFIDRLDSEHRTLAMAALRDQTIGLASTSSDPSRSL
ncbi:MAG: peptide deformylase [Actinomycetota bacterium]